MQITNNPTRDIRLMWKPSTKSIKDFVNVKIMIFTNNKVNSLIIKDQIHVLTWT